MLQKKIKREIIRKQICNKITKKQKKNGKLRYIIIIIKISKIKIKTKLIQP